MTNNDGYYFVRLENRTGHSNKFYEISAGAIRPDGSVGVRITYGPIGAQNVSSSIDVYASADTARREIVRLFKQKTGKRGYNIIVSLFESPEYLSAKTAEEHAAVAKVRERTAERVAKVVRKQAKGVQPAVADWF